MNVAKILQVFVAMPVMVLFIMNLSYKTAKKGRKRLNFAFSGFFAVEGLGLTCNIVYTAVYAISDSAAAQTAVFFLHWGALLGTSLGPALLASTTKMILDPDHERRGQLIYLLVYAVLLFASPIFYLTGEAVVIGPSTNWWPVWSPPVFSYLVVLTLFGGIIPALYFTGKIYAAIQDEKVKFRWRLFLVGLVFVWAGLYLVYTNNVLTGILNDRTLRTLLTLPTAPLMPVGVYLLYYGVKRPAG
jgi:hypothetical protein